MKPTVTIFVILSCSVLCSCARKTRTVYEDEKVKVIHKDTINFLNVHASHDQMWLVAFGKTYKQVRGQAPFYLEVPGRDLLLFVTGRTYDDGQATVHVLNYKTGEAREFPANDSQIGDNIVAASKVTQRRFEKVESLEGDKLVVTAGFLDRRFRYFIDLGKFEFEKEEAEYPNPSSGTTNYYVIPHGRNAERRADPILNIQIQPRQ